MIWVPFSGMSASGRSRGGANAFRVTRDAQKQNSMLLEVFGGLVSVLFRYDSDDPNTGDGLSNDIESLIGPGDSGGSLLRGLFLRTTASFQVSGLYTTG